MDKNNTIRIILAEDHSIVREGLRRLLEAEPDMEVVGEAVDGRTAIEAIRQMKPDVVLMDLSMPQLNGIEATRQIRKGSSNAKVICLSMHKEQKLVESMLRAGASGYLLKNCRSRELVEAIRVVASGGTFLSPAIAEGVVDALVRNTTGPAEGGPSKLTDREREVLKLIAEGLTAKEIGLILGIKHKTALTHRLHIMEKLNLSTDVQLARHALKQGITEL